MPVMGMIGRIRQALGLTAFLAMVEFSLLFPILLAAGGLMAVFDGIETDHLARPSLTAIPLPALMIAFVISFIRILSAGYPATAAAVFAFDRRPGACRSSLVRLMAASIAGYVVFRAAYYLFEWNILGDARYSVFGFTIDQTTALFGAVGATAVAAPVLLNRMDEDAVDRWRRRTQRALALVAVLIALHYILLVVIAAGLEFVHVVVYGSDPDSLFAEAGPADAMAVITGEYASVIILLGILFQSYTIMALLMISFRLAPGSGRRAGFIKLLAASFGGYALWMVLFVGGLFHWEENLFRLEIRTPWIENMFHIVAVVVILAPAAVLLLSRRIKWLDGLLRGL